MSPKLPSRCDEGFGIRTFYLDEAGDFTLFNRRGAVIVGAEGVSRTLMLGVVELTDPMAATLSLERLRAELVADPYFKNVPSMQISAGRTAKFFHAKDDLPEVRREVMKLLPTLGVKCRVAVRRKESLVVQARFAFQQGKKLSDADIYDGLASRLLKDSLHQADQNVVVFARRGKAERREALEQTIRRAKHNFNKKWGTDHDRPTSVLVDDSWNHAGLQIADYYLWALQRLFERGEDRFVQALADGFRLVMDLDDTRNHPYGEWYTAKNPILIEKIKPLVG